MLSQIFHNLCFLFTKSCIQPEAIELHAMNWLSIVKGRKMLPIPEGAGGIQVMPGGEEGRLTLDGGRGDGETGRNDECDVEK